MGAHKSIEKGEFMFDETYRIPFIARHPENKNPGTVCDEFIYLHDLFPTTVEIATGSDPDLKDSQSILPLLKGEKNTTSRSFVYGQFEGHFSGFQQRMLRTKTHTFVFNAACSGELYHIEKDPHELTNQINNPDFKTIKRELIEALLNEMKRLNDPLASWLERISDFY